MLKKIAFVLAIVFMLSLIGCNGGNVDDVKIGDYTSEIYTDAEITSAIDVTLDYFKKHFDDCTLIEITYSGDDQLDYWYEFAEKNGADDVIVLVSSFKVGDSYGDGSLTPNYTYRNFSWILVRNDGGNWKHVDHGY